MATHTLIVTLIRRGRNEGREEVREEERNERTNEQTTVGTWPSPYFLMFADSIWRGELDTGGWGRGRKVQRWITYRDETVWRLIISRSELYPVNALMLHGIVYGDVDGFAQQVMPEKGLAPRIIEWDFATQCWSFFATGANLQELYLTPRLMTEELWNIVGKAAAWAQRDSSVAALSDAHWIGGSPRTDEVYGWAGFEVTSGRGYFGVRNPHAKKSQTFDFQPEVHFELPKDSGSNWGCSATLVWGERNPNEEAGIAPPSELPNTNEWTLTLLPHQFVLYDAVCTRV